MRPAGIPISDLMARHCEAAIGLWNDAFLPLLQDDCDRPQMEAENEWDLRDRYYDVCLGLFAALVLWPLGLHNLARLPSYRNDQQPLNCIHVRPLYAAEIHVTAEGLNPFQGYDYSITSTDQVQLELRFQDFFDFDELGTRTFEWVRAVVAQCVERPGLAGRAVLLKRSDVGFHYVAP